MSVIEQQALENIRAERDYFKSVLWDMARSDAALTEQNAKDALELLPDPYPENKFGIRDRLALLDEYVALAGSWDVVKLLLRSYPLSVVLAASPLEGKPFPSPAYVLFLRLTGEHPVNRQWGIAKEATDTVSTYDTCSGTLDGQLVTLVRDQEGAWQVG